MIWTIEWVLILDKHMQIFVPPNVDLICGLVFSYVGYYQSPAILTIHKCFRQK